MKFCRRKKGNAADDVIKVCICVDYDVRESNGLHMNSTKHLSRYQNYAFLFVGIY